MKEFHPALLEHFSSSNQRAALASWGLTLASWGLLSLGVVTNTPARIGFFGGSIACCVIAKPVRSISIATERTRDDIRDISTQSLQNWLYSRMKPDTSAIDFQQEETAVESEHYDFDGILDEAVGIALLGNSGSGKSSVAKYIVGLMGQTQILVLDPHDDGDTWDGLPVLSEYADIVTQLGLLLTELDTRRGQRKQKQKLEPVVIICDEFPAVRDYCAQIGSDVADRFILRFGSESRKFDMLCLFCSQSGNTKALGLDGKGDFLENYLLIRLHKVARKYAKNLSDRTVLARIQPEVCGFPCLVGDEVSVHPTHGHYPKFAKGLPPQKLKPLQSLPLTIPLAAKVAYQPLTFNPVQPSSDSGSTQVQDSTEVQPDSEPRTYLERLWNLEFDVSGSNSEPGSDPPKVGDLGGAEPGSESGSEFPEIEEIDDETLRALIVEYRSQGIIAQDDFILQMWSISKGASRRYQRARDRYQAVCRKFGL
jgi:energy-coupling factor transporter ATP-binding protein EcfA2